jgi:hypothetical protein
MKLRKTEFLLKKMGIIHLTNRYFKHRINLWIMKAKKKVQMRMTQNQTQLEVVHLKNINL